MILYYGLVIWVSYTLQSILKDLHKTQYIKCPAITRAFKIMSLLVTKLKVFFNFLKSTLLKY